MIRRRRALPFGLWSALLLLVCGVVVLAWAVWPLPTHRETIPLGSLRDLVPESAAASVPGPEFVLHLQYPQLLRMGSQSTITAILEPQGSITEGNLPPNANLVAVAHIQSNVVLLDPNGEILVPLVPGAHAGFAWQAAPLRPDDLESTLFIRLEIVPVKGGALTAHTIFAGTLPMRGVALLGLTSTTSIAFGVASLLAGGVLVMGTILGRSSHTEGAR